MKPKWEVMDLCPCYAAVIVVAANPTLGVAVLALLTISLVYFQAVDRHHFDLVKKIAEDTIKDNEELIGMLQGRAA